MITLIENKLPEIVAVCKKMQVKDLYLFGSATTEYFTKESDVDFVVDYNKNAEGLPVDEFDYFDLWFALEKIVGRKVDLVVKGAMRNSYFIKSFNEQKVLLYG